MTLNKCMQIFVLYRTDGGEWVTDQIDSQIPVVILQGYHIDTNIDSRDEHNFYLSVSGLVCLDLTLVIFKERILFEG